MKINSQHPSSLNLDPSDGEIDRLLDEEDFNVEHMNINYDSRNSDGKPLQRPTHTGEEVKRGNGKGDLEALQRTLVERKILLCNLQIDIARRQLEAFDKPPSSSANS